MKIVQITDIHIGPDAQPVREVEVRQHFLETLAQAHHYGYDYLVLSGDLCFQDPQVKTYEWIQAILEEHVTQPIYIIAGNHDDSKSIAQLMPAMDLTSTGELYYAQELDGHSVLFLDSGRGYLSSVQKEWLIHQLDRHSEEPILLFMHHPPILGLVPHMDSKYALTDREAVLQILQASGKRIHVFCGHYHVDKSIHIGSVSIHITPSTFLQIDQRYEAFRVDHTRPGFRLIEWTAMGLYEQVVYLQER